MQNPDPDPDQDFIQYVKSTKPTFEYDSTQIQNNTTEQERAHFIQTNEWPWTHEIQTMYEDAVQSSSITKYNPTSNRQTIQSIFNQSAAEKILAYNSDEGRFLTTGILLPDPNLPEYARNSGLVPVNKTGDIVRCHTHAGTGTPTLTRIRQGKYDGLFSIQPDTLTPIPNEEIPNVVPGFRFLQAPCNPCLALDLNNPPDYSCAFQIQDNPTSPIWKYLWNK